MRTGEARIVIGDAAASDAKRRTLAEAKPVNDTAGRRPKTDPKTERSEEGK